MAADAKAAAPTPLNALRPACSLEEHSVSRVGEIWREEDHVFLARQLRALDELCIAIWKLQQPAKESLLKRSA